MKKITKEFIGFKDVVLIIGLTLVISIIQIAFAVPFAATPFMLAYFSAPMAMIISGSIFVLLMNKAPYKGTMILFIFILCAPMFFMGAGFFIPCIVFVIGGACGELIFWKNSTRTQKKLTLAYAIYAVSHGIGTYFPVLLTKDSILLELKEKNTPQELIDTYDKLYSLPAIMGAVTLSIIAAVIGIFIGSKIFKKHFARIS